MDLIQSMLEAEQEAETILREADAQAGRMGDAARQEAAARLLKTRQDAIAAGEELVRTRKAEALEQRKKKMEEAAVAVEAEIRNAESGREAAIKAFIDTLTG